MSDPEQRRIAQIRYEMRQLVEELERLTGSPDLDAAYAPSTQATPPVGAAVFLPSPAMLNDPICPDTGGLESVARQIQRQALLREAFFDTDLFADAAWNMLVELFVATAEGKAVTVSSLCSAARVPSTTALRWIRTLEEKKLIRRTRDPQDQRRLNMRLTVGGFAYMKNYLTAANGGPVSTAGPGATQIPTHIQPPH